MIDVPDTAPVHATVGSAVLGHMQAFLGRT